jgi:hypothetical protein
MDTPEQDAQMVNCAAPSVYDGGSLGLYGFELYDAMLLSQSPHLVSPVYALTGQLLGIYGIGLVRAWEVLGAQCYGLLSWLNPLRDVSSKETIANLDQSSLTMFVKYIRV